MKERLIGAAVLVALGVWLIPWVLDGQKEPTEIRTAALQLPAPEEPVPIRTQTLRLELPAASTVTAPEREPVTAAHTERPAAAHPTVELDGNAAEPLSAAVPVPEPRVAALAPAATAHTADTAATPSEPVPKIEPADAARRAPPPEPASKPAEPAPKPAQPPAGSWLVQLGSFGEEGNARRLAQRVGTFGYEAEISTHRANGRTMYRVRVGPHETRARADAAASALAAHGFVAQVVGAD